MDTILVTGGAGRLGRHVIELLLTAGYDVLSVDCVRPPELPCRFVELDLTDGASVHDVVRGATAVVHLAAVPGPTLRPGPFTFTNNVLGTYYVAEAAAVHGCRKLVFASSVFTLGWHEAPQVYWPRYVPVDEHHPLTPFEAYGLSKQLGEEICAAAGRRSGMPVVSLRIMNVIQPSALDLLPWPAPTPEQPVRFVLWPYVDVRDAAAACVQALTAETTGHEALFIAAPDTRFDADTRGLLQTHAPQVEIRGPLAGNAGVISIEKARQLIGYQPRHTWRRAGPDH